MKYKTTYCLLFIMGWALGLPLKGQNNPFKIDDELYAYYMHCNRMLKEERVLAMSDTLFRRAGQKKDIKAQCLALHIKCDHYYFVENIPALQKAILDARKFIERTPYQQYIFSTWLKLITYYERRRWYGKALDEVQIFQKEAIRMNNTYGMTMFYKHAANIYAMQRDFAKSLELNKKALEYSLSNNGGKDLGGIYQNIGMAYSRFAMSDSAIFYYRKALQATPNKTAKIINYIALGEESLYTYNVDLALQYIQKADNLRRMYPLYGASRERYFILVAEYHRFIKNYETAIALCDSISDDVAKLKEKELIYKDMNNFEQAYKWSQEYIRLKDSTRTADNNRLLADLTSRFDNERLNAEKDRLELRNSRLELDHTKTQQTLLVVERERNQLQLHNQELTLQQQSNELEKKNKEALYQKERAELMEVRKNQNLLLAIILGVSLMVVTTLAVAYSISRRQSFKKLKKEKAIAEQARREAENANRLKSLFLQNMSHEIRTPLNAIIGFTEVLNSGEDLGLTEGERKEMLGLISTNTDLLTTLINDILDLSKLESNTYTLNLSDVPISQLCHSTLASVEHRAQPGVRLLLDEPPNASSLVLRTDAARLRQILTNFLTNACKYTEKGNIILAYCRKAGKWEFSVSDTGCGIPADKVETVFERFEKLDNFKQGTGLGLNICQRIANLVRGQVYVDTSYTNGARFIFVHPVLS